MKLNHLVIILFSIVLFSACQNNGENEDADGTEKTEEAGVDKSTDQQEGAQNTAPEMPGQQNQAAATDISDEDLQKFVSALQQMQMLNQSAQQEMIGAVEATGLEVERFSQIRQAQQDPSKEPDASEEELSQFQSAVTELEKIQNNINQQMEQQIEAQGLSQARYDEIGNAIQNSPELQARLQQMMAPPQPQGAPGGSETPQ